MKTVFGWILAVIGVIGVGATIDNLASGKTAQLGMDLTMVLLFGGGGTALIRAGRRDAARKRGELPAAERRALGPRDVENAVLASARKHGGRITVTDVAADSDLTFTEAKAALDELARAGACETLVTEQGMIVYNFGEIVHAASKSEAS